jgi:ComF family protein
MNRCLVCFQAKEESLTNKCVCNKCLSKFKVIEKTIHYKGIEIFILYEYNDFFKQLLYRFKGRCDYDLKDAFLNDFLLKIKNKYKKRKVICAPSFFKDDEIRGFNHVKEISKCLKLEYIDCLKKEKSYKQSSRKLKDRASIQEVIKIDKTKINEKDKLLIVDDVATSLSTIKAIIHLLPTRNDKKVFVLASNCRFMENELN